MANNDRFPNIQSAPVPKARGYMDVEDAKSVPAHPQATRPAPTPAADAGQPWVAPPKGGPDRPVAPLDTTPGNIKALRSLKHLPVAGQGRGVYGLSGDRAPKGNGSGALPRKAK